MLILQEMHSVERVSAQCMVFKTHYTN